jgi:hypothetical protein
MNARGSFVVAWDSYQQLNSTLEVYLQLYRNGTALNGETLVNQTTEFYEEMPHVSMNATGDFCVTWRGSDVSAGGGGTGIFVRRYFSNGSPQGGESLVNVPTAADEEYSAVSLLDDGRFFVGYNRLFNDSSSNVLVQRYGADGLKVGGEIPVNAGTVGLQWEPSMAATPAGDLVITWDSSTADGNDFGISARRFRADGTALTSETRLNRFIAGRQLGYIARGVACDADGNYLAVWQSADEDGSGTGIYAAKVFVPVPAKVLTTGISAASGDRVTFTGSVNPGLSPTQIHFEYGLSPSLGLVTSSQDVGSGRFDVAVSAAVQGLLAGSQYYYRLVATNDAGAPAQGPVQTFTTAPDQESPEVQPATRPLRVVTPGALPWRLVGRVAWQNSGDTIQVAPGEYLVECQPSLPDEPVPPPVRIFISAGSTLETRTIDPLASSGALGSLVVIIEPESVASSSVVREERGQWRFVGQTGETQWRNGGLAGLPLSAGAYAIEFRPVDGKVGVAARTVVIQPAKTTQVRVFYEDETQLPQGAAQPAPIADDQTDLPPYCFAGQITSDAGSGSGTVVKSRVVLTAAHVVFDDVTLTYTTGVKWLFQRERGTLEPAALVPRGTYVFSSYAQVRLDARTRLGVGQATQVSQQRDAAAIYFTREAGRSGYTDVLATGDTLGTEWLANLDAGSGQPRLKTLVGYPVDLNFLKPQNGYSELDSGRMFRTAPAPVAFTKIAAENLPVGVTELDARLGSNRVYQTTALAGYAGGSGGALWVQYDDGNYYPAGIFVGGTGRCVVRAIDAPVVDLISRADSSAQAASDENNTGGGIARVLSVSTNASYTSAKLQVSFTGLTAGDLAKAYWTVGTSPTKYFGSDARFINAGTYLLHFAKIAGFREPRPFEITVRSTDEVTVEAQYVEMTAPTITTPSLKRAESGKAYSFQLQAAGGATGYEVVSSEIPGLTVSARGLLAAGSVAQPPGTYRVAVKATNASGSMARMFSLQVVATGHLEVRHRDVTDPLNVRALNARTDGVFDTKVVDDLVTITAIPQPGLVFKQWTGFGIENLPTTKPALTFAMKPLVILYAEFVRNPFTGRTGTYRGLLQESPAKPDTTGLFQLTLNFDGRFSGKVLLPGGTHSFGGKFSVDGSYRGLVARLRRSPQDPERAPLELELSLDPGASGDAVIRGTLTGDFTPSSSLRTAIPFSARLPATLGGAARVYTLAVPVDPAVTAGDPTKPHGTSVASLAVSPNGSVRTTLLLADGGGATVAGYFSRSEAGAPGQFAAPLFTPLYQGHGSFAATLVLNSTTNVLSGDTHWFRDAFAAQPPLFGSWASGLTSTARGELFPRPSTAVPVFANFRVIRLQSDNVEFHLDTTTTTVFTGILGATGLFFEDPGQQGGFNVKIDPKTGFVRGDYQAQLPGTNPPVFGTVRHFTGAFLRSENKAVGAILSQDQAQDPTNAPWELIQTP